MPNHAPLRLAPAGPDETHDPALRSWVESAEDAAGDFPLQHLPLAVAWEAGPCEHDHDHDNGHGHDHDHDHPPVLGVYTRIGDRVLSLTALAEMDMLHGLLDGQTRVDDVDPVDLLDPAFRAALRRKLQRLLGVKSTRGQQQMIAKHALIDPAEIHLEAALGTIPGYTDFYASVHHATNVGSMFRPDAPLLPNYHWLPIGYDGRAGAIIPSGEAVARPRGILPPAGPGESPVFGPTRELDYEFEIAAVLSPAHDAAGDHDDDEEVDDRDIAVTIANAERHILGLCLLNDWSARDIQRFEYQPLGPFLGKNFATSMGSFMVPIEALAPFRAPRSPRGPGVPAPLPHLDSPHDRAAGAFDITCEAHLATAQMRARGLAPHRLSRGNFKDMHWTLAQMIAHHASNGCTLRHGDIIASGTVSGPTRDSRGCLLELTWDGDPFATPPKPAAASARTPIDLPTGERRTFLEDGDEVILTAYCQRDGYRRIGFGECRAVITPPRD